MKKGIIVAMVALVVLVTAVAFFPSLSNDFVDWDDTQLVTTNSAIRGFTPENIKKMFTTNYLGHYIPLVMVSFAAEYHFFGLDPFIYHLTNYVLHILITVAVFYFLYLLSGEAIVAFVVAMLFGIHPLHVESVAWITERKDLLYSIFYMLALISYMVYLKKGKKGVYLVCFLFAVLSLFSKAMAVTLPVVLLLVDWFRHRGLTRKVILEKVPFFGVALLVGLINLRFEMLTGATHLKVSLPSRIYALSKGIPFYLYKTVFPVDLSALYPYHRTINLQQGIETVVYIVILIILGALVAFSRRYTKKVVFGSLFFLVTILPVLKIIPAGSAFAADRYMYLPSIGLFYIFGVFVNWLFHDRQLGRPAVRTGLVLVFAAMTLTLSVRTWHRCAVWNNTQTLFNDVIRSNPLIPVSYNKVGAYFAARGKLDEAIVYFKKALRIRPDFMLARQNMRRAYIEKGMAPEEADAVVEEVIGKRETPREEPAPTDEEREVYRKVWALNRTGVEQGKRGEFDKAISSFKKAIELDPNYPETYNNLGFAYYKKGEYYLAEEYFKKALEVDPSHERAWKNLEAIRGITKPEGGQEEQTDSQQ
ncbi:MAG: tetratricopeptide repeat protein [Candidatus Omnitrophica bacterium]|nr:tetratricopeptide repeat protein [Candidatus Omnitrophota bacterium]